MVKDDSGHLSQIIVEQTREHVSIQCLRKSREIAYIGEHHTDVSLAGMDLFGVVEDQADDGRADILLERTANSAFFFFFRQNPIQRH